MIVYDLKVARSGKHYNPLLSSNGGRLQENLKSNTSSAETESVIRKKSKHNVVRLLCNYRDLRSHLKHSLSIICST